MIVMMHFVMMNLLRRMMVRRLMMDFLRGVVWGAWGWLRRATWRGLLMNSIFFVQIRERPSLLTCHLLELQKILLLGHMCVVGLRHLLEGIRDEVEIKAVPRIARSTRENPSRTDTGVPELPIS